MHTIHTVDSDQYACARERERERERGDGEGEDSRQKAGLSRSTGSVQNRSDSLLGRTPCKAFLSSPPPHTPHTHRANDKTNRILTQQAGRATWCGHRECILGRESKRIDKKNKK